MSDNARYRDAVAFLVSRIDYERVTVPYLASNFRLARMNELLDRLGNPHAELKIVHIAGTKGKGSTAAMISSIVAAGGYRTGLFTSPHLDRLEERIVVDGSTCGEVELADLVDELRPVVAAMDSQPTSDDGTHWSPTYFELTTALALMCFARRQIDLAILEVGMGGRLDSTNVCQPVCTVITNISIDHTRQLGTTHAEIAGEKAGIIKQHVPVVSGVIEPSAQEVVHRIAAELNAEMIQLGSDFDVHYQPPENLPSCQAQFDFLGKTKFADRQALPLRLLGAHQAANAAVAIAVIEVLRRLGWELTDEDVRGGLAGVECRARVEIVAKHPLIVVDAAHNVASIEALAAVLDQLPAKRRTLVFATSLDKDCHGMLAILLPRFHHIVFTRFLNNPRSTPPQELEAVASLLGADLPDCNQAEREVCDDPVLAWNAVKQRNTEEDLICVTGSFFIAAEMRRLIQDAIPQLAEAQPAEA